MSTLLMVPLSAPLWTHLPELHFIQFPWRWLGPLDLACALLTAACMSRGRKGWAKMLIPVIVLGAIGTAAASMVHTAWWDSCDAPFIAGEISSAHGYEGTDEYAPLGSDHSDLLPNDPAYGPAEQIAEKANDSSTIVRSAGVQVKIERWSAERKAFTVETAHQTELALHVLDYPAWAATVDGEATQIESAADTAQIILSLPAGSHHVELRFKRTWDRVAGDTISFCSAIGLLGFAFMRNRKLSSS